MPRVISSSFDNRGPRATCKKKDASRKPIEASRPSAHPRTKGMAHTTASGIEGVNAQERGVVPAVAQNRRDRPLAAVARGYSLWVWSGRRSSSSSCSCGITRCSSRTPVWTPRPTSISPTPFVTATRVWGPGCTTCRRSTSTFWPRPDAAAILYSRPRPSGHAGHGVGRVRLPDDARRGSGGARRGMRPRWRRSPDCSRSMKPSCSRPRSTRSSRQRRCSRSDVRPRARSATDRRWFLAAGAVFGLATLNRPNMALAALGIGAVLLAQRRVRPAVVLVAGLLLGMSPVAIRNVVVVAPVVAGVVARRPELLHRQRRGGDRVLPSAPGHHAQHHRSGGGRPARRRAGGRAIRSPTRETSDYFFARAWAWMGAHPAAAARLLRREARVRVQRAAHRAAPQLSVLRLRLAYRAALSRRRPVAAAAAGTRRAGVRRAARSAPRLRRMGGVRAGLYGRGRRVLRRRALPPAAVDPDVRRRGRGNRRRAGATRRAPRHRA